MSDHHETHVEYGGSQKTLPSYVIGLVFCIILTLVAFALVEKKPFTDEYLYISLAGLAIIQLFVQAICFLRLNSSADGRWNLMPFLFTLLIIAILVSGSLWIMYNINYTTQL